MKKKLLIVGLAVAVIASAQFGISIVSDPGAYAHMAQDLGQAVQLFQLEQQTQRNIAQFAAQVSSPGYWKQLVNGAVSGGAGAFGLQSNGFDINTLSQLKTGNQASIQALSQVLNTPGYQPTASNSALLQLLHMQTVQGVIQQNQLADALNRSLQLQAYRSTAQPPTVGNMNSWEPKQ